MLATDLGPARLTLRKFASTDACETIRCLHREALDRGDVYSAIQLVLRLVDAQGAIGITQEASKLMLELLRTGMNLGLVPSPGASRVQSQVGALTAREQSVLRSIGRGLSNKGIARELGIAPETVKSHAKRIFVKLSVQTRAQAVTRAVQMGFV
jgi:LuxR family maltose regulon positive regulatory protein